MRKSLLYILFLALVTGACALEEQDNPLIIPTCYDGIRNQDEKEIDCGGRCQECVAFIPIVTPCTSSLKNNVINVDGSEIRLESDGYYCGQDANGGYKLSVNQDDIELTITLTGPLPTKDQIYPIVRDMTEYAGKAIVRLYEYNSGPYIAYSGDIYVRVKDGNITAEFCSLDVQYNAFYYTSHRAVFGSISCQ